MPANPLLNGLLNVPDQGFGVAPTNGLAPPNLLLPPDSGAPTQAQGVAQAGSALWQAVQALQWPSVADQKAMLQPLPGWQGQAVDAARQYANSLLMGSTAPRGLDPRLFVPAMKLTMDGRRTVFSGNPGELHEDLINRVADADPAGYDNAKDHDLGFVNQATGRYYTRDQAAAAIGIDEASDLPTFDWGMRDGR